MATALATPPSLRLSDATATATATAMSKSTDHRNHRHLLIQRLAAEDDPSSSSSNLTTTLPFVVKNHNHNTLIKRNPLRLFRCTKPNPTMGSHHHNDTSAAAVPYDSTMRLDDDDLLCMAGTADSAADNLNVLQWLQVACPPDVLPKVLACCGPQKAAALSKTNRYWHGVLQQEGTWRVLCEELYKWKPGDEEPASWAEHYRFSPSVPIDYSSVHKALQVATLEPPKKNRRTASTHHNLRSQVRAIRILLRPGTHYLRETVNIQAAHNAPIIIQAVQLPETIYRPPLITNRPLHRDSQQQPPEGPQPQRSVSSSSSSFYSPPRTLLLSLMRCHKPDSVDEAATASHHFAQQQQQQQQHHHQEHIFSHLLERRDSSDSDWLPAASTNSSVPPTATLSRACLVFRSKRNNEPAIRVRQGTLVLSHVDVAHHSDGLDIWNGNAALQIQPSTETEESSSDNRMSDNRARPMAILHHVHITSQTGRGIVNIDGGRVRLHSSAVTDCAATGIYIGGTGSQATLEHSDVLRNGLGSSSSRSSSGGRHRAGIARGHSGVYLEQGVARIVDCNVSRNTLTGISVVSPNHATLVLEQCDLMGNGTNQLEMPPAAAGWVQQQNVPRQNQLSVMGRGRPRSGLAVELQARGSL